MGTLVSLINGGVFATWPQLTADANMHVPHNDLCKDRSCFSLNWLCSLSAAVFGARKTISFEYDSSFKSLWLNLFHYEKNLILEVSLSQTTQCFTRLKQGAGICVIRLPKSMHLNSMLNNRIAAPSQLSRELFPWGVYKTWGPVTCFNSCRSRIISWFFTHWSHIIIFVKLACAFLRDPRKISC